MCSLGTKTVSTHPTNAQSSFKIGILTFFPHGKQFTQVWLRILGPKILGRKRDWPVRIKQVKANWMRLLLSEICSRHTFPYSSLCSAQSVTQSCPTLCNPIDCSPPGSSVHGILQARILEQVAISCSRGSSWPRDPTRVPCVSWIGRRILYHWTTWKAWFLALSTSKSSRH